MIKNTKLLVSTALTFSFLIGNISLASLDDFSEDAVISQKSLSALGWKDDYQEIALIGNAEVNDFLTAEKTQKKAWKNAGGAGTLYPESAGARLQKTYRTAVTAAKLGWDIAEPFVFAAGARVIGDFTLSYIGPWVVERAGIAASSTASTLNSWWTRYDPFDKADKYVRYVASKVAEGEALRDLGFLTDTVQTYAVPVANTVYKATLIAAKTAYTGAKILGSAVSSAYSWGTSWFASPATASTAEAA
ncbi:MAG: hypothetical protein IBJ00_01885 [Alphaproteobacteria bacterium]|nr:hypothetical protein [Alphaproteobacteria bacterium]